MNPWSELTQSTDFQRPVHAVLGLVFDATDEAGIEQILRQAAAGKRPCFLSTPNLNFVMNCLTDDAFRNSVIRSDLSIADGWPIVAVSRLLGCNSIQRITGSGLFERMLASSIRPPLRVFFFGGPPGAAAAACCSLNATPAGLTCVGFDAAGYGDIEQMSTVETVRDINAANADFIVVALGAKKGQAWIMRNKGSLSAPLISHLGAVVNFAGQLVKRAPGWVQNIGLEWLWRIAQEPPLARRFASDGWHFILLLVKRIIPLALHQNRLSANVRSRQNFSFEVESVGADDSIIRLNGFCTEQNLTHLRRCFETLANERRKFTIDLNHTEYLDTSAIGLIALAYGWNQQLGREWIIASVCPAIRRLLLLGCFGFLIKTDDIAADL